MSSGPDHEAIAVLLGAYALDAVDRTEAAEVESHLASCPRCRDELAQHHETAAMLANGGGEAPAGLWDAIAAKLDRPPVPAPVLALGRPSGWPERTEMRRRRSTLVASLVAVAAAAAAAAIAALGVQVGRLDHRVNQLAAASADQTLSATARDALLDPTATRIVLVAATGQREPLAEVVEQRSGAAYLFNWRLPVLARGNTYQLWALIDGEAISVGLLGTHPATVAFSVNPEASTHAFAITVEPAGGTVGPTRRPVAITTD